MIRVWMLIALTFSFEIMASEFTHIKLNPVFEEYLTTPKLKRTPKPSKQSTGLKSQASSHLALAEEVPDNSLKQTLLSGVLGATIGSSLKGYSDFPTDGEESLLYEEIRRHLEAAHQGIGEQQTHQLDLINRQFNLGTQNFSGFSWQKPFGAVQVWADRQVVPNLFADNWLIQDTFTIEIEATTFLEKLNESGLTTMSNLEIGAFAGITFKRVYTYYHYANSYAEGIRANFSKLFLPFLRFNQRGIDQMEPHEIMKRQDLWSAGVGGLITTPPVYNLSFSAGVLAEYASEHMVSIQNNPVTDATAERLRMSVKGKTSKSAGATLSLQLDFFKLIKLTLLSYDLTYEYTSSKEFTLGMSQPQIDHVQKDPVESAEFKRLLRGFGEVKSLEPYVVRLDESSSSSTQSRSRILLWGKLKKSKTEQIRTIKGEMVKIFYKNYSQSIRIVQNFFSRLFSAIVHQLLKLPVGTKNAASYTQELTLEYEATHPQAGDPKVMRVESTEKFSFVVSHSYEASKTHRWIDKRYKNDVIWFLESFTSLPADYRTIIRSEQLRGPLKVESHIRIEKAGLDYFIQKPDDDIFYNIAIVCESERANDWAVKTKRERFLNRQQTGSELCVKKMGRSFLAFKADYIQNARGPSLARLKEFIIPYHRNAEGLEDFYAIFGEENTFVNGSLNATTSNGNPFFTSFSSGQFRGLGVIDNFKRSSGSRSPASIINE